MHGTRSMWLLCTSLTLVCILTKLTQCIYTNKGYMPYSKRVATWQYSAYIIIAYSNKGTLYNIIHSNIDASAAPRMWQAWQVGHATQAVQRGSRLSVELVSERDLGHKLSCIRYHKTNAFHSSLVAMRFDSRPQPSSDSLIIKSSDLVNKLHMIVLLG